MIIELQNFGPIKSFKFDTSKDMHAIFGKNNIGKSYAISAVYLILKGLREFQIDSKLWNQVFDDEYYQILENKIQAATKKTNITESLEKLLESSVNQRFMDALQTSFENSYNLNTLQNIYGNKSLKIILHFERVCMEINFSVSTKKFVTEKVTFKNREFFEVDTVFSIRTLFIDSVSYGITNQLLEHGTIYSKIIRTAIHMYSFDLISSIKEQVYFLPVSRSGLYNALSSFGAIFAELSRNRNFITRKIEIPNMTEPISDYFLNLNTIDKAQANEHYLKHFEEIEQEILKGKITLDNDSKKYYYVPNDTDMRLELSFTSSMISEIAPIIAHLKYIIPLESDKPSILFIEEPEAHLHPEIQILLIEYFVKLCKGKVKIVMTSHSNYIFNKLSNLLIDKKIDSEKLSVMLMKMTPEGSVIDDGAMHIDEYGIEDSNFVDVAEQLYEERMALLEKS